MRIHAPIQDTKKMMHAAVIAMLATAVLTIQCVSSAAAAPLGGAALVAGPGETLTPGEWKGVGICMENQNSGARTGCVKWEDSWIEMAAQVPNDGSCMSSCEPSGGGARSLSPWSGKFGVCAGTPGNRVCF